MRKIRNPRFAPEFLERRLTPSAMVSVPAEVQVISPSSLATLDEPPSFPPTDPYTPSGGGVPPVISPTVPGGDPSGPALAS